MDRRQFNALAGQTMIALVLSVTNTAHPCRDPNCVQCRKAAESKSQEPKANEPIA
jgi:hypothetical protein